MLFPDTGGWSVTHEYAGPGRRCLSYEENGDEIAMNANPMTSEQMRVLAVRLNEEANKLDFEGI